MDYFVIYAGYLVIYGPETYDNALQFSYRFESLYLSERLKRIAFKPGIVSERDFEFLIVQSERSNGVTEIISEKKLYSAYPDSLEYYLCRKSICCK